MANDSEETLKQEDSPVLKAIAELSEKIELYRKNTDAQLEAIREGIAFNSVKFDNLTAEVYEARADIAKIRASLTQLSEEVRRKALV